MVYIILPLYYLQACVIHPRVHVAKVAQFGVHFIFFFHMHALALHVSGFHVVLLPLVSSY